jgi:hypothetical protein
MTTQTPKPGRFDYVAYDAVAQHQQSIFKTKFEHLVKDADELLNDPRYKALVLTKLEEAYAFVGKAIREDQWMRTHSTPLHEQRGPG